MAKITAQNLKDLGFVPEMFANQSTGTFDAFLAAVIDEQAELLTVRIGPSRYADTGTMAIYVAYAEKSLCIAELWDRRITTKLGQAKFGGETQVSTAFEEKQRDYWRGEGERIISAKIISDSAEDSVGFASGVLETSHYDS